MSGKRERDRAKPRPLYRKVNTRARGVDHHSGGDYRWARNAKPRNFELMLKMVKTTERGLDYTPLYRFLLGKVGEDFDTVYSEAVARLDKDEPIFHLVARSEAERRAIVRIGESTFYSGLYVDDDGRLAVVDPAVGVETLEPDCPCCTHTFNGVRFTKPFREPQ